jgi:hypothetical protein
VKISNYFVILATFICSLAQAYESCDSAEVNCRIFGKRSSSTPAYPTNSSSINANPSAVPTDDELGIETIYYKSSFDFLLVRGTGRIGAAISPTNSEQIFFGAPALEPPNDYLTRMQKLDKYPSQKINLATALLLYSNHHEGLSKLQLNLGVLGRYNTLIKSIQPGGGISSIIGPFTLGYSASLDDTRYTDTFGLPQSLHYQTQNLSAGLYLTNFVFDYSLLYIYPQDLDSFTVNLITFSLLLKRWIFTASQRIENSTRPGYDFDNKQLTTDQIKKENFAGIQFAITKHITLGGFYNYYLLREFSAGLVFLF